MGFDRFGDGCKHVENDLRLGNLSKTRAIFAELHDRIQPGCSNAFARACVGREIISANEDKVLSLLPSVTQQ
jgi:hypothetical protein